ncbi:acyltransferase family protein [Elizabethkingia anophelis]|uniref:acyltransferase family protein n=1 Tax=Elizabethkingia anophelis TaxID=1117645 RepID=UPI00063B0847|nr:acyltransferase [Elizabethkingia anophelis]AKH95797.1 hypothetical protein M876_14630 [Elizabethkingia anophelis FMS-007]
MKASKKTGKVLWADYLRSSITVLVIAHHSSLAYTTFAKADDKAYINSTAPIIDSKRYLGLDIFENFNDIFFMFLMFFISGLFVIKSIKSKGNTFFIKDRFNRLFIPFWLLGVPAMLLAYFPAYYTLHHNTNIVNYVSDFFIVEQWPVGPPWFIWVLFIFNLIFAVFYPLCKDAIEKASNYVKNLSGKPIVFFMILFTLTWITYVPISYCIGQGTWTGWGPFDFQLNRIFTYFGYFVFGIVVGNTDFSNGIFSEKSPIIKNTKYWALTAVLLYITLTINNEYQILEELVNQNIMSSFIAWMIYLSLYTATCSVTCIAFISIFRYLIRVSRKWWNSLSDNAYMIYLIHYIFVVWTQFLILDINISAIIKFFIVLITTLIMSLGASFMLRKIDIIKKFV